MASGSTKSSSVASLPQLAASNLTSTNVALNPLNPQSNSRYATSVNMSPGSIHQIGLPEMALNQQALRDQILGEQ